jgi:hypothetical protein
MKKINLDFNFKDLDGKELKDSHAGKFLATILVNISTKDPLKLNAMAQKLYNKETIELDPQDLELLKETILSQPAITNGAKAQLLLAL